MRLCGCAAVRLCGCAQDWHDYESGVFAGGNKTNPDLDHLVQLVGYGKYSWAGSEYWYRLTV